VTSCGPGSEVLATARAVGDGGVIRATDKSGEMIRICAEHAQAAAFKTRIECAVADASDTLRAPWDVILCAFRLWPLPGRDAPTRWWAKSLAAKGKVAVITWGPSDAEQPFEQLAACLREVEPGYTVPPAHVHADRDAMARMFAQNGLVMVRHTVM